MIKETEIALRNYEGLLKGHPGDVELDWETGTVVYGDGGADIEMLILPEWYY
jgi:hypothetical protein